MNEPCPSPESIAALAEGTLNRNEIAMLMPHIETCAHCRDELALAGETLREESRTPASRSPAWWSAVAAAAAAILVIAALLARPQSPVGRLVKLAPRSARVAEPRLSGGFPYAPYRGPLRSEDPDAEAQQLKISGAAGEAIERAAGDDAPRVQQAAGVAYVLIGKPREAVERLRAAAAARPDDAAAWSDLAAAQYAAAMQVPAPSLLPQALASADRALRIDPAHPEALFNRALVLGKLGLIQQARDAWTRYLAVDPSSPWATEARARLAALPQPSGDALFRRELPRLERAAAARDFVALGPIVGRWREQSRAWGEAEYLGRWSEAAQRGETAEAVRLLAIARSLGEELRRQSGESLLADAVAAIDRGDAAERALLAGAHAAYRRGRIAYSRQQPTAAEPDLRRAAALFARAGSPMARMALYYAANTRVDQNDLAGARGELETLIAENGAHPAYLAAGALMRWELSRCDSFDGDFEGALALLYDAAAALRRVDERNNLGSVESMIADALANVGRPDEAWSARIRSFEALSRDGRGDRLLANLASAVSGEEKAGNRESALALLAVEREVGRELGNDVLLSSTLASNAVLSAALGDDDGAAGSVREGIAVASRITDPAFRAIVNAHLQLARGAAILREDPRAASDTLGAAVRAFDGMGQRSLAIHGRLLRARAESAAGASGEALREIDAGLEALQTFEVSLAGRAVDAAVLDSGQQLVEEAIRLRLDRGETALAFGYADRARMQFADAPPPPASALADAVRKRLAGSGTVLLEIVVLPEETVTFCVDEAGVTVSRQAVARDAMIALARRVAAGDREAAKTVQDRLVSPAAALRSARTLVIVADPLLEALPFAALYDARSGRYLIQTLPTAIAESAASLRRRADRVLPAHVLAAALPPDTARGAASLPESADESRQVAGAYTAGVVLPPAQATFAAFVQAARGASVVHLSGHTGDDGNGSTSALVFAGGSGERRERVGWRAISALPLGHRPVVVLAACDSLRLPRLAATRAPSLGGAFLAAGAADAVGTLRPVADREARELFCAVHRELAAGLPAADALREVQMRAIAADRDPSEPAAWTALAVLTREIP